MRKTEPCPFYGVDCEYVPMAHKSVEMEKEIERLREALKRIAEDQDGIDPWIIAENALKEKE